MHPSTTKQNFKKRQQEKSLSLTGWATLLGMFPSVGMFPSETRNLYSVFRGIWILSTSLRQRLSYLHVGMNGSMLGTTPPLCPIHHENPTTSLLNTQAILMSQISFLFPVSRNIYQCTWPLSRVP